METGKKLKRCVSSGDRNFQKRFSKQRQVTLVSIAQIGKYL